MIDLNDIAPDFGWRDASGEARSLHGLRDRFRVAVLFARDEQIVTAWQKTTRERAGEFAERDMISVIVGPFAPLASLRDEDGSIARGFGVEGDATAFFLIGKDGTVKRAWNEVPVASALWAQIDSMPMRQREMDGRS